MFRLHPVAALAAALSFTIIASAADDPPVDAADPVELETVIVSGQRSALPANLPNTTSGVTGSELRERVFINTEDALRELPDVEIRKRYVGDRNALIGGRSFGTLQAPRGLVYADGVLLSNFLGRFNAPRWNMVAPEEISRVDVLYGPFSALYPGNSIGTTVLITTRDPDRFTASSRVQAFTAHYADYGYGDDYDGRQYSAFAGNRWGGWSGTFGINHLENRSQPMQYVIATPAPSATDPVDVTGAVADTDPRGNPRLILGPDGGALEDDTQDQVKARLAWENTLLRVDGQVGYWRNEFTRHGASFLRDSNGNAVTRGAIRFEGRTYKVADSAFGPQDGVEEHWMYALTGRTHRASGWNISAVASLYDIAQDELRASIPTASNPLDGNITQGGAGRGWWNIDVQTNYRSDDLPHAMTFGYYLSRYDLDSRRYDADDWRGAHGALIDGSEGRTRVQAAYAQDAWRFAPSWTATAGLRLERWEAYDGARSNATTTLGYARRSEQSASPKLSIAWSPASWALRYSIGRGVRYPTVSELFQGSISGTTLVNNDPNLEPERSLAHDLTWENTFAGRHDVRVSLFHDDVQDSILQQTNVSVTPNVTNIQNVKRVVTNGVEVAYGVRDLLPDVDLDANATFADSRIRDNPNVPASEGKHWLRVPRVRANFVANWRFRPDWNANLALRHSGRQYNELDNGDHHPGVFGGASAYTTADARIGWRFLDRFELGTGVANLTGEHYYIYHPYPGRTWVADLRGSF